MRRETFINLLIPGSLLIAAFVTNGMGESYYVNLISRILIFAIAGAGLNLALGYGGMVSLGHAAFFGIGAYVAGILAFHVSEETPLIMGLQLSNQMPVIWLVAALLAACCAFFIGFISLRTNGVYFIMITLAFAQMFYYFAISWPTYGGEDGLVLISRNPFPGLDTDQELNFFLICFGWLLAILMLSSRIIQARFGAALEVARMNETRLATAGINPFPIKLTAFIISAMIVAVAGALYADLNRFVSPNLMNWQMSGELIIIILLGGVGRLMGPVIGAILFVLLETIIGAYTEHWKLFLGIVLLGIVLYGHGGVMQLLAGNKRHD